MTLWHPDTCGVVPGCQIELGPDGEPIRHVFRCSTHEAGAADHAAVAVENRFKNRARAAIAARFPALVDADISWTMDPKDRSVTISVPGLSAAQTAAANLALSALPGGKVRLA